MKRPQGGPVVRHTTITPDKEQLEATIRKFIPAMISCAHKKREREGWEAFKDKKNLLALRKELLKVTRHGMLGRENREAEIALLACVIWALRRKQEDAQNDTSMGDF